LSFSDLVWGRILSQDEVTEPWVALAKGIPKVLEKAGITGTNKAIQVEERDEEG
jgi:hypothetical protein